MNGSAMQTMPSSFLSDLLTGLLRVAEGLEISCIFHKANVEFNEAKTLTQTLTSEWNITCSMLKNGSYKHKSNFKTGYK